MTQETPMEQGDDMTEWLHAMEPDGAYQDHDSPWKEKAFWTEYRKIEEDKKMPYITSVERFGREEGMLLGMEKGMEKGSHATLLTLVRNAKEQGLTDEMIGRIAGLDAAMVQKILRNEPVDLPPHLLKPTNAQVSRPEAR